MLVIRAARRGEPSISKELIDRVTIGRSSDRMGCHSVGSGVVSSCEPSWVIAECPFVKTYDIVDADHGAACPISSGVGTTDDATCRPWLVKLDDPLGQDGGQHYCG
ncbi:hypothetical protein ACFQ0O_24975 [Saccharopolyspora spinosporotrichia]